MPDPYLAFRKSLLTPERVRELSRLSPQRAVFDVCRCWATIIAAWLGVAFFPAWWSTLLAMVIVGTRYYALFIIGHDGLHRRVFSQAKHNDLFTDLFIFGPIGAITRLNNRNHIAHHQHLATVQDPDRHKHGSFNKTEPIELLGYLTGVSSILRSVSNVFGRRGATRAADRGSADRYSARDLLILVGWQAALITGLSLGIGLWAWPVLWLLPVYVFTFLGDNARSFAEHSHPELDSVADRHRLITFESHPLELLFFAPMHMNFHASHHLWPSIPYYRLKQAEREMRQLPGASAIEVRSSYVAYLGRYLRSLPFQQAADESSKLSCP